LDGLLVVDKPGKDDLRQEAIAGTQDGAQTRLWTSHDVVARVRRLTNQRRIGHTGTLDPMASGVLVLCLGLATRLVEYYQGEDKRYSAEVVLGSATDTYDAEGTVTATAPIPLLTPEEVEAALSDFRGVIMQVPPAFSAIKQEGKTLYARARRGEPVTVEARPVTFHCIELLELRLPDRLLLSIHCSAGAYIRSLAHDLGRRLGTLGTLAVLRRESVGTFLLHDAATLSQVEDAAARGCAAELLRPPGDGLPLPQTVLDHDLRRRFGHGQHVLLPTTMCPPDATLVQVRDEAGALAGIIRCLETTNTPAEPTAVTLWKAEKWLS
jgi:tRNA pseudouridine55 synthase